MGVVPTPAGFRFSAFGSVTNEVVEVGSLGDKLRNRDVRGPDRVGAVPESTARAWFVPYAFGLGIFPAMKEIVHAGIEEAVHSKNAGTRYEPK